MTIGFWSITQMPMDEDNKKIVARSFGYIGHILTKSVYLISTIPTYSH
jgi:hypothetical protein